MIYKSSFSRKVFVVFNYTIIIFACILCLYPLLNILAISLSSKNAVEAGMVGIIPVGFNLDSYIYIIKDGKFFKAFGMSVIRVLLGVTVQMTIVILAGYPLSKTTREFPQRNIFMYYFVFTTLIGGGLIPTYLVVKGTGLINSIWALILPGAVSVYNVILLQNYLKGLPEALCESAKIDGAGEWRILVQIMLPLSKPILSTLVVFTTVGHWNAWFDGMLYMNREKMFPLQTYLRTVVVQTNLDTGFDMTELANISSRTNRSAQIFIAMIPVLCVYPFFQKYFTTGIVLGSVKG